MSSDMRMPDALAAVHTAIVSCERCPRLRDYCRSVAEEKKRAHRDETYWGRPVPGFGDPERAAAAGRAGARRARRQPHRARVHRRRPAAPATS